MMTTMFAPLMIFPLGAAALIFSLWLKGVDRILIARLQRRIGPPMLQPFFDIIKLMRKQTLVPHGAPRALFLALPAIGVGSLLIAITLIPIAQIYQPAIAFGDLLVVLYLLTVPAVVLMLAGSCSGSVYGAIGFSREMALVLAYEGPLLLALASVALKTGLAQGGWVTFSLSEIVAYQQQHGAFLFDPWMWPALAAYVLFMPANLGIAPFDIPEAESEVLEGPILEYTGPALALFHLMSALKTLVVVALGITLFFPNGPAGFAGILVFLVKCLMVSCLCKTLLRAMVGRMRIDQAFVFYLKWPELLGVIGLISVIAQA
ncbi:respiratory chain complex I subunit 1 family protein [Candidatus Symbiopectobacterium sp. NZEC135]|uniref:respiratory chain complex I subunit 1 family protein n=1 Tax=Candidatus Symbiopectobacterium sp. NZEC135 TaxID=2820471 RepID=UPI002225CEDE|nr:complex I subunit 1 family protein [Candidatus Symbiopectobacterium sp. NZEC135]MCW2479346.1 NADH-quinone oxidoreductase subunit H [Candidatus Symbiopectobacterium sp. NZEC135]